MSMRAVLAPLFVEVLLTFGLMLWMGAMRVRLVRSGQVRPQDIALREPNWPKHVLQVQNAASNQFELPVLFYVLTILSIITRDADLTFVILAWVFVLLRLAHAYIHVTSNNVRHRGLAFITGAFILMVMWAIYMLRLLLQL
ncbi:MAG: MAPEG family protein [Xanthobacteraceae bacterium]